MGLLLSVGPTHLLSSLRLGERAYGTDRPRRGWICGSLIHELALSWGWRCVCWFHRNWGRWCQDKFGLPYIGGYGLKPHWVRLHRYGMEFWLPPSLVCGRVWQILHMVTGRW